MNEFRMNLNAYPLIFYHNYDNKLHLENSNKVLLPTSVLNNINRFSDNIKILCNDLSLELVTFIPEFISVSLMELTNKLY